MLNDKIHPIKNYLLPQKMYEINSNYLCTVQVDGMTESWRSHICSWIHKLGCQLNFNISTSFMSLNYVDRYLSIYSASRKKLQLLALVSVYVASKFNETNALTMTEANQIAADEFTIQDIKKMEIHLLEALKWHLNPRFTLDIVDNIIELFPSHINKKKIRQICHDIYHNCWNVYKLLKFKSNEMAIGCIFGSLRVMNISFDFFHMFLDKCNISISKNVWEFYHFLVENNFYNEEKLKNEKINKRIKISYYEQNQNEIITSNDGISSPTSIMDMSVVSNTTKDKTPPSTCNIQGKTLEIDKKRKRDSSMMGGVQKFKQTKLILKSNE